MTFRGAQLGSTVYVGIEILAADYNSLCRPAPRFSQILETIWIFKANKLHFTGPFRRPFYRNCDAQLGSTVDISLEIWLRTTIAYADPLPKIILVFEPI